MEKTWQYNGVDTYGNIFTWCLDNLPCGTWEANWETFLFYDEKCYTVFLLRWG